MEEVAEHVEQEQDGDDVQISKVTLEWRRWNKVPVLSFPIGQMSRSFFCPSWLSDHN